MSRRHQPTPGQRLMAGFLVLTQFFWLPQSRATTYYWNTDASAAENNVNGDGLGGTGDWDLGTANWWNHPDLVNWTNANTDHAIFSGPAGPLTLSTVTLATGLIANKLTFARSGYTLSGGDLTLAGAAPTLHANLGESATINSLLKGVDGLTKTGGGTVRLGNAANSYTGVTTISNGSLVISDSGALGEDTSTVVVSGSATRGFGGGQLVLDGTSAGFNFTRDISLQGMGPIADRSAALISVGTNEVSGAVSASVGLVSTRIISAGGRLTFSGSLDVAGTAATTITGMGGAINSTGTGSYAVTGALTGTGTLEKTGSGTLLLDPSNSSGFSGTVRAGSSATGTISSIRITSPNVLGTRTAGGTGGVIDMNTGTLEVRMDNPSVLSGTLPATVYQRATSTMFVDHSIGGSTINGTATFGTSSFEDNITPVFNSRNGYGMTFGSTLVNGGDNGSGFNTNMGGLLTFNGTFWNNTDNVAARTMTITSTGNSLITGNIIASAAAFDHALTKAGAGMLTITSNGTTLDGAVNVNAGILGITDFRAINNNSATINIGAAGVVGTLNLINDIAGSATGLTTTKVINLAGTTGGANIYANQPGSNPVILNTVTATGAGAKTFTLGGANTANNIVNGAIPDGATATVTSLAKNGAGTWVLAGANTFTGSTTITGGTLKIQDTFSGSSRNVLGAGAVIFGSQAVLLEAGGTLEYVGAASSASAEAVGALTPTAGAGTVKVTAGSGGSAALTLASLGTRGAGATINYAPGAGGSILFTANPVVTNSIIAAASGGAAYHTFNGVNWAALTGSTVSQYAGYTVDALPASGTGGANVNYSQSVSAATTGTASINTLKLIGGAGNPTVTLGGLLTVTAKGVLFDNSSGGATITGSQLGAANLETVFITNGSTPTNALTVDSLIGSGTGSVTKAGTGTLVVGGANTYTGNTIINEGTIRMSGAAATLGAITTATNVTTLRQGATLDINAAGASNTITIGGLSGAGTITNSGGGTNAAGIVSIGSATSTTAAIFSGILKDGDGVLNVTKMGTFAQSLLGLSTYTGATTIGSTGLVTVNTLADIGQASGIGAGNPANNAASLVFNGSTGGLVYAGANLIGAIGAGSVSATTNRLFTLSGTGATLSSTASNGNSIVWSNTGAIAHGIVGPQTLTLTGTSTGDNRLNPQLTDSDTGANITSVTKTGTGVWVLGNGNNLYTGLTTVSNGALALASAGSLPTNSPLLLNGTATAGTLEASGTFIRPLAATATAGSGTVSWGGVLGGGFSASGEKLIVAIGATPITLATPTPLQWGAGGFVATGAALLLNSTTATGELEFRNDIDLNGGARTITVNDNTSTATDFATITGVISNSTGTGSLNKAGTGILQLLGNNTYSGVTSVSVGTLVVTSLGNTATPGATSVGDSTTANTAASAVTLGNGTTGIGTLQYIGPGETSDRLIRFNTTTGSNQIFAEGAGPLILTNVVNDMGLGAKSLTLRGTNTAGNMITSVLADNGGALGVIVDGGATWILTNGANSYTGTTAFNAGALGVGHDTALGTSILAPNSGSMFAYGGDRVIANQILQSNNTTSAYMGEYGISFTNTYALAAAANNAGITNNIASGKSLQITNITANSMTATRALTINGTGDTSISGDITTTTAFGLNLSYTGNGTLTLSGANLTLIGTTTLNNNNGTLRLIGGGKVANAALTVNAGTLLIESIDQTVTTLTMGNVANTNALIDVATSLTLNVTAITYSGTTTLASEITGEGTLGLGAAGITVTVADNITLGADMLWTIDNLTGTGTFIKAGAGTLDISGIATNSYVGSYQLNAGAILGLGALTNNIILNGGVYEGTGSFTRALGTGDSQIQWLAGTAGGGFSAQGGNLTVDLGSGASDPLAWGTTANFVPTGAPLIFGSTSATGVVDFANDVDLGAVARTIQVTDNTAVTTDRAELSGVLSGAGGGVTKTGNGNLRLTGASTFTGPVTVTTGTLQFTTVSDNSGGPSSLGQGTNGISIGAATLAFAGDGAANSQTTNRGIAVTASGTLAANGTNGATITYSGPIAADVNQVQLTGTGQGFLTGGVTHTSTAPDLLVSSGNWTVSGTPLVIGDEVKVNGASSVLNLNSTGVLTYFTGTSNFIYIGNGGTVNLGAHDVTSTALGLEGILPGFETAGAPAVFNTNTFDITTIRLDVGQPGAGFEGHILGSGTINVTSTTAAAGLSLYRGLVTANLAGPGALFKQGMGDVTLSGNNSGLTGTTRLDSGNLILDYTTSNTSKLNAATALDMRGGTLTLNGNTSAPTIQNVASFTLANGGANVIAVNSGGAQSATLNLGALTRANSAGTIRFLTPVSGAINTTTTNHATTGMLGATGTAFATVNDGTETNFARVDGSGNIVALTSTAKNDVTTWAAGNNVTDETTGFTGTTATTAAINSLRFNAAGPSTVNIAPTGLLTIASGGILQTSNVTAGNSSITGGRLVSGTGELVFTIDSASRALEVSADFFANNQAITKTGPGTLVLSGSNYNSGITQLQNGTLRVIGGSALGDRAAITLADDRNVLLDIVNSETIGTLAGGSATSGLDTLAVIAIGANNLTVNQNAAGTYSGLITGTGTLTKTGNGTLALGGAVAGFTGNLVVNRGQLTLATRTIGNLPNVGSVTLNAGTLVLDFTGGTEAGNKINNSATVTLINTGGIDGLRANNDRNDASKNETVGILNLLGGANTITPSASSTSGTTQRNMTITTSTIVRGNQSTLLVRGQNLGTTLTGAPLSPIHTGRFVSTVIPTLYGSGGAVGSTTISIVPWAVGSNSITGTGESFVTAVATTGFRPLDLTTEYEQLVAAGGINASNNVRYSNEVDLLLNATSKTMNSLLVNNSSASAPISITGSAGTSLNIVSGAFLFTGTQGTTLDGFNGINVGAPNEYVLHTVNTSAAGVTINSPFTTPAASFTKSGAGTLTLTATGSTYTGQTAINQGILQIDSLNKLGNNGSGGLLLNGGTLRFGGIFDPSAIVVNLGVLATGTVATTAGGTFDTNGFDITVANSLGNGGNGGLTKTGAGIMTLNATINYDGVTSVNGGTLLYGIANALPSTMNVSIGNGILDFAGFTTTLAELTVAGTGTLTGTAPLTITGQTLIDGGAARTLTINNTALTSFTSDLFTLVANGTTARTLTLAGTGDVEIAGQIVDGTAAGGLTMAGTGTLTLNEVNTYTGITTIDNGTLVLTKDQNLAGALRFGTAGTTTTTGTLDLTNVNATFGGALTIQTNSTSAASIIIGATKTLTINNNVTIGSSGANSTTVAEFTGGGSMVVSNSAAASFFAVGGAVATGNKTTADLSDLGSLTISLNTTDGIVRVNPNSTTNVSDKFSTLILPSTGAGTTTITAATLAVGDSGQNNDSVAPFEQINVLKLGSGVNTFNVNTVNIGTGTRDVGSITFNTGTGSLILRDAAGTGRAAFNMGTGAAVTAFGADNTFDVTGHNADLLLGAVNIGTQAGRLGPLTNIFSFNQGILDMSSLNLSSKGSAGSAVTSSTFNIGGGTVNSGLITMATTTTATAVAEAHLNITGGTVTMSGNIVKGGGAGTDTATLTLDGASAVLNMGGNSLGGAGAAALDNVILGAGTIQNIGEFNGGAVLTKSALGTLTFAGTNTYTGGTAIEQGLAIAAGGANNRLSTTALILGGGSNSGVLQLGNAGGASNQTLSALSTSGTGTANAIVGGNAAFSTLTVNQATNTTFVGNLGGAGANENNLNLIKDGIGELVIDGARTYAGTTSVLSGKLFIDGFDSLSSTSTSLTLADGTEFSLRGTSSSANVVHNFSGSGNVITVGSTTGATLGFALDGGFNSQLNLAAGQTMTLNGTLTTAVYVNNAPNAGQEYTLINGADDNSIFGSGTFNLNPVVFNGGSFTYALSQITAGTGERWVLTPTAQAAADNVWWKGDLTGIATGVWSASLTLGDGFPTNWDDSESGGGNDALVPPDSGSIVHFSATGAGNFTTTLGANLTIQELIIHPGGSAISIGSSGGTNTLTLGNALDSTGLTMMAGAPNVSFSANIALAKAQAWNIADTAATLTLSGGLSGTGPLTLNGNGSSTGTLILTGANGLASHTGGTNLVTGKIILEGGADDRLPVAGALTMGDSTLGATLQLGDSVNGASNNTTGTLSSSTASGNAIVGGASAVSTLTVVQASAGTFHGIIGGGAANQNNLALTKQGTAILTLNGANTYTGTTTVNAGTLLLGPLGSLSTPIFVSASAGATAAFDIGGRAITLTGGLTLDGADATATPQIIDSVTGGLITLGGNVLFDGTNDPLGGLISANLSLGATARTFTANNSLTAATDLTLSGSVTTTPGTTGVALALDGTGSGLLSGPVILATGSTDGSTADLSKNGAGTWTIQNTVTVGDDYLINTGTFTIGVGGSLTWNATGSTSQDFVADTSVVTVNLNVADAIVGSAATNRLFARDGAIININADDALGASIEQIILGDNNQGIGNLVMNANATLSGASLLQLGNDSSGEVGNITGTGTLSGLATINLNNGMVSANLAGAAGNIVRDNTVAVTLSGNNSLGTGTTLVREGLLTLDYTTHAGTDNKIGTGNLTLGVVAASEIAAVLTFNGNATAASLQTVSNLASAGGPSDINLISNGSQDMLLRVTGLLSRTNGTLNINMPNANTRVEYTGATTNSNGIVGAWMTINNNDFATISGGQIVAASYTTQNNASLWMPGANVTNDAGFTGTVDAECNTINSLRFDAPATSNITVAEALIVSSGGIMVTSSVGASSSTITGGSLVTGTGAFIFHQGSATGVLTVASSLFGGAAITKNGAGVLVLSGSNNTGVVNIDEGLLRISGGRAINDTSAVNIRNISGAGLEVTAGAGNSETIGSLSGGGTGTQVLIGTGAVLTLNQTAAGTFTGAFNGAGTLTKNGTAVLTVSGNAAMTGPLIINQGRITMNGSSGALDSNSSYTLNGAEFLNLQDQTSAVNRISDTTVITLNNTAGTNGLFTQRSVDSLATENVGAITIGAGHNVITTEATLAGNLGLADLLADNMTRTAANHATVLVRGLNLGTVAAGARRAFVRFDAAGNTAVNALEVGGGGGAGALNISIIPWMIGDVTSAGLGNTFVTNVDGTTGLRPLTSAEYTSNAGGFNALPDGAASTNNVRFDTGATLTSTATAINSLVIDAATAQTVTGPANALEITTGALLASGAGSHILSGFTALTTGGGRDYTIFVTNSATQNFTVNVPLTSTVPLVKSGAGILTLTNVANAFTDVYMNQGLVAVDDLDKLGTGNLNFFGGGIRVAAGFADDLSSKTWNIGTGGGIIDVSLTTAGATFANGIDDSTAGSNDTLTFITRSSASTGLLTIQGASSFTGTTIFNHTGVNSGTTDSVVLNGTTNAAINGNLQIGSLTGVPTGSQDIVISLGNNEQIVDTAAVSFNGTNGESAYFKLRGFTETVAGITDISTWGVIENREADTVTAAGTLILNSSQDFSYNGFLRDASAGTVDVNPLFLTKQGTGTQTLSGANIRHSGATTISGGTLTLQDVTNWQSAITNNATLTLNQTTGSRTHAQDISGTGTLTKLGNGTVVLGGTNTYSGVTRIDQGTLSFASAANLGDGTSTNAVRLANGAILQSTGASVDLGSTRNINLAGVGGAIEVTSTNILTVSGVITGDNCSPLIKTGPGLLIQSGVNTYAAATQVNGGILQAGLGGAGQTGTGDITVASGATLTGQGSAIKGAVTVQSGGFLQVGDVTTVGATAPDTVTTNSTVTLAQALTLQAGSITVLDITNSTNAGSIDPPFGGFEVGSVDYRNYVNTVAVGAGDHDRLAFDNGGLFNPTIEAGAKIVVKPNASFVPLYGMIFNMADWQGLVGFNVGSLMRDGSSDGTADDLDLPDISGSGLAWDLGGFLANGSLAVVPEPGRMLLLFMGLLGLFFRRRRTA